LAFSNRLPTQHYQFHHWNVFRKREFWFRTSGIHDDHFCSFGKTRIDNSHSNRNRDSPHLVRFDETVETCQTFQPFINLSRIWNGLIFSNGENFFIVVYMSSNIFLLIKDLRKIQCHFQDWYVSFPLCKWTPGSESVKTLLSWTCII
jgi:hypothetical protein